jgi:hypothetical protein
VSAGPHPNAVARPAGTRPSDANDGGGEGAEDGGEAPGSVVPDWDVVGGDTAVVGGLVVSGEAVAGGEVEGTEPVEWDGAVVGDTTPSRDEVVGSRRGAACVPAVARAGSEVSCPAEMTRGAGEPASSIR